MPNRHSPFDGHAGELCIAIAILHKKCFRPGIPKPKLHVAGLQGRTQDHQFRAYAQRTEIERQKSGPVAAANSDPVTRSKALGATAGPIPLTNTKKGEGLLDVLLLEMADAGIITHATRPGGGDLWSLPQEQMTLTEAPE